MSDTNSPDRGTHFASIRHQSNDFPLRRKLSRIRSAMPIRHYLQGHRFDAETVRLLGVAFEMALVALQHLDRAVSPTRDAVAQKIIELAKAGERDPGRLCDAALEACLQAIVTDPSPLLPHASPPAQPDS